ncbi:MAG: metallophosphoesterase, partial [Planctomycetota bacterium]|nr:metallophosphoesterase [Planctomycetota bacterium]
MKLATLKLCLALAACLAGSLASAASFTVAVIPDTQNYCDTAVTQETSAQVFARETAYLVGQKAAQNIVFTSHVGDVVQHGDLNAVEWTRATTAMNNLAAANMAFGMVPGNHDYDNYSHTTGSRPLAGSIAWNANFGPGSSYFAGKSWYGGSFNGGLDSYQTLSGGGYNFLHISLEQEASDTALAWAQGVLDAHPNMPAIVTTHEYISYQNGAD